MVRPKNVSPSKKVQEANQKAGYGPTNPEPQEFKRS